MSIFYRNFYSTIQEQTEAQRRWFDEGPFIYKNVIGINSSSINTTAVDKFRQGVEITQNKHAQGGVFKISAGTPGHIVNVNSYGVTNLDIISENYYKEVEIFDPTRYLRVQEVAGSFEGAFVFPIISKDVNQADNYELNGIIEPFTIRAVASFFSIEFPFESRAVRGSMMGGNTDQLHGSSDLVVSIDYYPRKLTPTKLVGQGSLQELKDYRSFVNGDYFLDAQDPAFGYENAQSIAAQMSYLDTKMNVLDSFDDSKIYIMDAGVTIEKYGIDMFNALAMMTGSLDNYIAPKKKSAASGFVYDSAAGTDSIAFGGTGY